MRRKVWLAGVLAIIACCAGIVGTEKTEAAAGPWIGGPICPWAPFYCLDVWDPVTCSNGVTYSNQCYADRACATGCVPGYPSS